jgi:hypothetical protein
LKVGIFDVAGIEVAYPGYLRADVAWGVAMAGVVANANEITFPPVPDRWVGSIFVDSARVFDASGAIVATVPMTMRLMLSAGITLSFMPDNLRVLESMLSSEAVDKVLYDLWPAAAKLPTNCKKCNHYNEYVGPEHLTAGGDYICRSCR